MKLFTQTAKHCIHKAIFPACLENLPELIHKHTNWSYSYQRKSTGCFLVPTFSNMPYRNAFVPEIEIVVSVNKSQTIFHISGKPVKFVRLFTALWFALSLLIEAFLIVFAIASKLDSLFPLLIPIIMCIFGYLLCKLGTKATFNSVIKAIQKELS